MWYWKNVWSGSFGVCQLVRNVDLPGNFTEAYVRASVLCYAGKQQFYSSVYCKSTCTLWKRYLYLWKSSKWKVLYSVINLDKDIRWWHILSQASSLLQHVHSTAVSCTAFCSKLQVSCSRIYLAELLIFHKSIASKQISPLNILTTFIRDFINVKKTSVQK